MVSFNITMICKCWYIVGAYVPPHDQPTVHRVEQDMAHCPAQTEILIVGDLNTCLTHTCSRIKEYLATDIVSHGLEDQ